MGNLSRNGEKVLKQLLKYEKESNLDEYVKYIDVTADEKEMSIIESALRELKNNNFIRLSSPDGHIPIPVCLKGDAYLYFKETKSFNKYLIIKSILSFIIVIISGVLITIVGSAILKYFNIL